MSPHNSLQSPIPDGGSSPIAGATPEAGTTSASSELFDSMFEGVQIVDFDWRYVYLNRAAAEHGRRSRDELIGQKMTEMYPGIDRTEIFALMRRSMLERTPQQMVNRFEYPDGSDGWFDLRVSPVPSGILVLSIDITSQKLMEQQLLHSQKMEAVGSLAGGIAHDFNNLITVIAGYADLLATGARSEASRKNAIEQIRRSAERAGSLTRQLLAFSRRQILEPKVLDLNREVDNATAMLSRVLGEHIVLSFRRSADLDRVVFDPGKIEQILVNLAINARDAMPHGGRLTVETANVELDEEYCRTHADSTPGRHVMIAVTDTGGGMEPSVRERIFEPFFTTKAIGRGTGLGLSTVYGIVKQSGGNIWVYSEVGRGSTFKVYLPSAGDVDAVEPERPPESGVLGGSETILLVEDEEGVRALYESVLTEAGYNVLVAEDGRAAIRWCESYAADIHALLTDVVLPDVGGRDLAGLVLAARPGIRVIYTSGYTANAIVHQGVLEEGTAFIEKPVRPAELLRKVRAFLD